MKTQPVIMLQIADPAWTRPALDCACKLARSLHAKIALVQMVPVRHPLLLASPLCYLDLAPADLDRLYRLEAALAECGIAYSVHLFEYVTLAAAVADAADLVEANIVFATLPQSIIPWWRSWQLAALRRRLVQDGRHLILQPTPDAEATYGKALQVHARPV